MADPSTYAYVAARREVDRRNAFSDINVQRDELLNALERAADDLPEGHAKREALHVIESVREWI